ncbi:MAG: peptidylprolyl isomerase, partial [Pseudomonadota bacterium]
MARKLAKKASNIVVWAILGLLVVALAGFGVTSFTGGSAVVGRVGSADITVDEYFLALQNEIRVQSAQQGRAISIADLQASGLDAAILRALVGRAALLSEAREMGLSVGDAAIAEQVRNDPNFVGASGGFDPEVYRLVLASQGLSPGEYEEDLRDNLTRALLQVAVIGGVEAPAALVDAITARETERRDFSYIRISVGDLEGEVGEPTAEDLQAHYEANEAAFTRPEQRAITYAWVTPEMILDEVDVDPVAIERLYESRLDEFQRPERRLIERLTFPSEDAAAEARAALDAGETDFETLVEDLGLTLDLIDDEVSAADLPDEAAAAVFAEDAAEIVGPVAGEFGPTLYRINAVLGAVDIPLDEASEDLRAELAVEAARRALAAEREAIDDALVGGATLEDLAAETLMQLGQIDYSP